MIREATPADVGAVLGLVRELAAYEREPDAVVNTEAPLHEVLFGPDPRVHCLVAEVDGEVVGTAIWFVNYSTWTGTHGVYLEDLFVKPVHRSTGLGRELLAGLARIAVERGYARMEWAVLNWNEPAIGFYRSLGARPMDGWTTYRLSGAELARLGAS